MDEDIYQAPSAILSDPVDQPSKSYNWVNINLLALFLAPLLTSMVATLLDTIFSDELQVLNLDNSELADYFSGNVVVAALLYVYAILICLPIHLVLRKLRKQYLYLYLAFSLCATSVVLEALSFTEDYLFCLTVLAMTVFCTYVFWVISAQYLRS